MSNSAWCDLNSKSNILKLHDKCHNPKCGCQKVITFTRHHNLLEGGSIKSKLQKKFGGTQTAWNKFIKPRLNKNGYTINIRRCGCKNKKSSISPSYE